MAAIRTDTSIVWGQLPLWFNDDTEEMQNQQRRYNANYLVSANQPMIYQAMWSADSGAGFDIDETYVPAVEGDVVNVIFKIYATTEYPNGVYHYVASTLVAPNVPACLKGVAANDSFRFQ